MRIPSFQRRTLQPLGKEYIGAFAGKYVAAAKPKYPSPGFFGLTKTILCESLKQAATRVKEIKRKMPYLGSKLLSEIFSKTLEHELAKRLTESLNYPVKSPRSDNDPDLLFSGKPPDKNSVEIKCASGDGWRGGTLSKRVSPTLMVTWDGNFESFYVAMIDLKHSEWTAAGKNYYAPTISRKELYQRTDRIDIVGSITPKIRNDGRPYANGALQTNYDGC